MMQAVLIAALLIFSPKAWADSAPTAADFNQKQALDSLFSGSTANGSVTTDSNSAPVVVPGPAQPANAGAAASPASAGASAPGTHPAAMTAAEAAGAPPPPKVALTPVLPGNFWMKAGKAKDALHEGDPALNDQIRFNERLFNGPSFWNGISDQICRAGQIPAGATLDLSQYLSVSPSYKRYLHRNSDNSLLLVDQTELKLNPSYGQSVATLPGDAGLGVSVGSTIDGTSMVIRPLESTGSCKGLLDVADLRDVKLAVPLTAQRMAAMKIGEIWDVPLVFTASVSLGTGYAPGGVPLSISFGYSRSGGASVTVRRMDKDHLRVRIRIDYAQVYGPSIGMAYDTLAAQWPQSQTDVQNVGNETIGTILNAGILSKLNLTTQVSNQVYNFIDSYLNASFSALIQWNQEDHAMIEFVLDPSDSKQLQGLEDLLKAGKLADLGNLAKLAKTSGQAFLGQETLDKRLREYRHSYDAALSEIGGDARTFTGTDRIFGHTPYSIVLKLPFLGGWSGNSSAQEDHITYFDDRVADRVGGFYDVYREQSTDNFGFLNLPFVGNLISSQDQTQVMTYDHRLPDGTSDGPALVYTRMEGYTHHGQQTAREVAVDFERITERVGTHGAGINEQTRLPSEAVFPKIPQPPPRFDETPESRRPSSAPWYRRGNGTSTLALSPAAIRSIFKADPRELVHAYLELMPDDRVERATEFALAHGTLHDDGGVDFDPRAVDQAFPNENQKDEVGIHWDVHNRLERAQKLSQRLREVEAMGDGAKNAADAAQARARGLRDLFKDADRYGLDENKLLAILVQFVGADDVLGELTVSATASGGGAKNVDGRYLFQGKALEKDPEVNQVSVMRGRFNKPSQYTD